MVNYSFIDEEGKIPRLTWQPVTSAVSYQISRRLENSDSRDFVVLDDPRNPTTNLYFEDYNYSGCNEGLDNGTYTYKVEALSATGIVLSTDYTKKVTINTLNRVGWTFGNYCGEKPLTADDLRYTYIWGNNLTASNDDIFQDEQLNQRVREATADVERWLNIDITKKVLKCQPDSSLIRGVHYDDEDDPYDFRPLEWQNWGFIKLNRTPVISVERAVFISPSDNTIRDITDWLRVNKKKGTVNFIPKSDNVFVGSVYTNIIQLYGLGGIEYPHGFKIDYTVGFEKSEYIPEDIRGIIGKQATIKLLNEIGDGILAGFSSASNSIDGMSQSFSSTQSATSAYFGARITQYKKEIDDWLKYNRNKWNYPMAMI